MKLLDTIQNSIPEKKYDFDDSHLKLLFPNVKPNTREEVIYRKNGKSVDKVVEFDITTGSRIKTTHYDYFNDKKIRSIDEFDRKSGKKIRTINFVLYKSIDEYDLQTGKKIRTINYNVKDESKISSIQEYDIESGKIIKISIYKRDGRTVSIEKKIDPVTEKVTTKVNNYSDYNPINPPKFSTRSYDNVKRMNKVEREDIARLIDNLYKNESKFEQLK